MFKLKIINSGFKIEDPLNYKLCSFPFVQTLYIKMISLIKSISKIEKNLEIRNSLQANPFIWIHE